LHEQAPGFPDVAMQDVLSGRLSGEATEFTNEVLDAHVELSGHK